MADMSRWSSFLRNLVVRSRELLQLVELAPLRGNESRLRPATSSASAVSACTGRTMAITEDRECYRQHHRRNAEQGER